MILERVKPLDVPVDGTLTLAHLATSDTNSEIEQWLRKITQTVA